MSTNADATVTIDQIAAVVDRAASDPAFRQELLSAPQATLAKSGLVIRPGGDVKVVEDTLTMRHAVVAARPDGVSDADLAKAASEKLPAPSSVESSIAAYTQLVAESWTNSALRSQLLADPAATLAAHGISVPAGVSVEAIESSPESLVLAIPPASDGSVASSITGTFTNLTKLITAGSYIAGLGFSIGAIMKFKQHKDNPTQIPVSTPLALQFVAAALLFR